MNDMIMNYLVDTGTSFIKETNPADVLNAVYNVTKPVHINSPMIIYPTPPIMELISCIINSEVFWVVMGYGTTIVKYIPFGVIDSIIDTINGSSNTNSICANQSPMKPGADIIKLVLSLPLDVKGNAILSDSLMKGSKAFGSVFSSSVSNHNPVGETAIKILNYLRFIDFKITDIFNKVNGGFFNIVTNDFIYLFSKYVDKIIDICSSTQGAERIAIRNLLNPEGGAPLPITPSDPVATPGNEPGKPGNPNQTGSNPIPTVGGEDQNKEEPTQIDIGYINMGPRPNRMGRIHIQIYIYDNLDVSCFRLQSLYHSTRYPLVHMNVHGVMRNCLTLRENQSQAPQSRLWALGVAYLRGYRNGMAGMWITPKPNAVTAALLNYNVTSANRPLMLYGCRAFIWA